MVAAIAEQQSAQSHCLRSTAVPKKDSEEVIVIHGPLRRENLSPERTVPEGWDRRAFLMRSAMATAITALTGNPIPASAQTPPVPPAAKPNGTKLSPDLALNKTTKGPVMTLVDEM